MEGKDADVDVKSHFSPRTHHERRQSQKSLGDTIDASGEERGGRRSTVLVELGRGSQMGEALELMAVMNKAQLPKSATGAGDGASNEGEMDASAGPKRTGRSGTITMDPTHSEALATTFGVISRSASFKARGDSFDSTEDLEAGEKEGGLMSSTMELKQAKAEARHGRPAAPHGVQGDDDKAEAKDGLGGGGEEDEGGVDLSKESGISMDLSMCGDSMLDFSAGGPLEHSPLLGSHTSTIVGVIVEGKDEDAEEAGDDKEEAGGGDFRLEPSFDTSMSASDRARSNFVLSFEHGLSIDQSGTPLRSPGMLALDTPGKPGVRRARPDPLMMGGGPVSPGKGDDIDPSFAISLKFNSPADTDYSFGEMTMRTLNTSTAAETVIVRTPSDSLIRELADFERYYDMSTIQPLSDEVQGAQGRVFRIMKRRLAFAQPVSRLQNANQRRDSGSSWVVVKESTQNAKLDALCFPRREWTMIRQLAHPYVIRLADTHLYNTGDKYRIVMEEMDCNLQQFMKKGSKGPLLPEHRVPAALALELTYLVGLALHHLNSKLVVFLDLKPDNILCTLSSEEYDLARDSSGRAIIKLTDFGTCKFIGGDERHPPDFISVGTPGFQSPESRQDRYTVKADVFSLGCVFYTLITGTVPFAGLQANDEMAEDAERMRVKLDKIDDKDVRALLSRMLSWEPRGRPTMDKVLRDPIFQHLVRPGDVTLDGPLDEQVAVTLADITVKIQLLDIATLHDPDAVVLSTALEVGLAETRRTATSYAAALMAALEVPTLRRFGEEFAWREPVPGLKTRDVRIVQLGRLDGKPLGNLGNIWMALFKNRESKTRVSLIQMYQYWRVALPDIVVSHEDMSKLYIGFLGVSRTFSGVSNSRILRQMVVQELLSLAEYAAISPDLPPGKLRTILLYEWKFMNYSLFLSELAALCLECTLGFMGDDLLTLLDTVIGDAKVPEVTEGLKPHVEDLRTALDEATQEFCSALAFAKVCMKAKAVALYMHPRWKRHDAQPMMASPHAEMEDREALEDALELLDYLGERSKIDEDMLLRDGACWLVMTGELDARRALVCVGKVVPDSLRPRQVRRRHSVDSEDEEEARTPPRPALSAEVVEARRKSSGHRGSADASATHLQAKAEA